MTDGTTIAYVTFINSGNLPARNVRNEIMRSKSAGLLMAKKASLNRPPYPKPIVTPFF
jgi:hypothetical protein